MAEQVPAFHWLAAGQHQSSGEVPVEDLPAKLGLTDYEIVDDEVIPADRTFRNAWVKTGATVVEDLTKSKEVGHDLRRAKRAIFTAD